MTLLLLFCLFRATCLTVCGCCALSLGWLKYALCLCVHGVKLSSLWHQNLAQRADHEVTGLLKNGSWLLLDVALEL